MPSGPIFTQLLPGQSVNTDQKITKLNITQRICPNNVPVMVTPLNVRISGLFPLAYAAVLTFLLLQAFRMMRLSSASASISPSDRTGLKTIHPELLDENGLMTNEELWAVRFSDKEGSVIPEA